MSVVGLVDYGSGNIKSVYNSLYSLGADVQVLSEPSAFSSVDKLILPGVGAFGFAAKTMRESGFFDFLNEQVLEKKIPILGICMGMQIMASKGSEGGGCEGLGWFEGEVRPIACDAGEVRVPHVGWNSLDVRQEHPILKGLGQGADFYFVHSYHFKPETEKSVLATVDYGIPLAAVIGRDNIVGTQFHPEKSQSVGLRLLENFLKW